MRAAIFATIISALIDDDKLDYKSSTELDSAQVTTEDN